MSYNYFMFKRDTSFSKSNVHPLMILIYVVKPITTASENTVNNFYYSLLKRLIY